MNTLYVPIEESHIKEIFAFIRKQAGSIQIPETIIRKIELAAEEIFINVVKHALPRKKNEVEIICKKTNDNTKSRERYFCLTIRDWGPPFDPLAVKAPEKKENIDDISIGGLGVYFVTSMADDCFYKREKDSNFFTVCFRL